MKFVSESACTKLKMTSLGLAAAILCQPIFAGDVAPEKLTLLQEKVRKTGVVAVKVTLFQPSLDDLQYRGQQVNAASQEKASSLLSKLGKNAFKEGQVISPLGVVELLVNEQGLNQLKGNKDIVSFTLGDDWHRNILIPDLDGSLAAINDQIERQGTTAVEVFMNVDGADFSYDGVSGKYAIKLTKEQSQEALAKSANVISQLGFQAADKEARSSTNPSLKIIETSRVSTSGVVTLQVDRRTLQALARDPLVLTLKPAGFTDPWKFTFDPSITDSSRSKESIDVAVQIRIPLFSSHASKSTREVQSRTNQSILDEVLSGLSSLKVTKYMPRTGTALVSLSPSDLTTLARSKDVRLRGVTANKPMYQLSLSTSTVQMGLPTYAWGAGIRGAGQTIYILDSGVDSNHPMLQQAGGGSKVLAEACMQSSEIGFSSTCPGQNFGTGDSYGPGTGQPWTLAVCDPSGADTFFRNSYCSHGTHVAGIAAGRYAITDVPLQGVAPDANLASINLDTKNASSNTSRVFLNDWLLALDYLQSLTVGSSNVPAVINMSFGGSYRQAPAPEYGLAENMPAMANVTDLKAAGIPVVAAMGNAGQEYQIDAPSNIPGIIKVGSLFNTATGNAIDDSGSLGTNRARETAFPGEYIFFAPGNSVRSAIAYQANATAYIAGTSMATPQVSGVYALIKGWQPTASVNAVSDYIYTSFSYQVTGRACDINNTNCGPTNWRAVGRH